MYAGKVVFAQITEHLPLPILRRCVQRYGGHHKVKSFTCLDQFLCMSFAQLTYRESLRDIEACLRAHQSKLYHMGIRGGVSRNTLANANKVRDWRIYADFAQAVIQIARTLYLDEAFGVELASTVYALDAATIDLRGNIPTFIHISDGKLNDVNALDLVIPEAGAFYVMDRGYLDFRRLYRLTLAAVARQSGSRVTLPSPGPLRTRRASFPAPGSSLDKAP